MEQGEVSRAMQACSNCGQPKIAGKQFCTRCGARFPDEVTREPGYTRPVADRSRHLTAVLAMAGVALLAGIGVGAWFLVKHHDSQSHAESQQHSHQGGPVTAQAGAGSPVAEGSPASSSPDPGSPAASSPASGSVTPSEGVAPPGPVAIAPATTGNPMAPKIAAFLDEYFDAINTHDYQAYVALRSPQAQGISQAQFNAGYGSTADTGETLHGISSSANGDLVAEVTFISRQSAAESASDSACTAWNISIYLVPNGDGYLIDDPPSSYHAGYTACG
jgi:hypothetical protein